MTSLEIHPEAAQELADVYEHYLTIDEGLARSFDEHFRNHRDSILANPFQYNIRCGPTRRVNLLPRFREIYIAYMLWRDKVVILAVAHAKRRPYYWRNRAGELSELF